MMGRTLVATALFVFTAGPDDESNGYFGKIEANRLHIGDGVLFYPGTDTLFPASSYGVDVQSSGVVRILKDLDVTIEGRHVLIVEDIIDSGLTLEYLRSQLQFAREATAKLRALESFTPLDQHAVG